ncbi:TIGR03089 family protein [Gephyromycinifex aptenodytis]|uniref:TIGR03089 family protein n=1 Tax=Gephyromycinifex aptenodytis TaxID=2716227 RepID=UPI0014455C9E|nr:TIGR03089 family protein [Gephyromycinifex aptenodytis]
MSIQRLDGLSSALGRGETGRPRLTWYAQDERIELSGRVLNNWVCKATNLLIEEFDIQPAAVISLEVPVHWRACYWALAAWRLGATVHVVAGSQGPSAPAARDGDLADVRIVLAGTPASGDVVALTPASLARSAGVALPPGHLDEAAVLSTYGDEAEAPQQADPQAEALLGPNLRLTFAPDPCGQAQRRGLLHTADLGIALAAAAQLWSNDGSLVLVEPRWGAIQGEAELQRIAAVESATLLQAGDTESPS